MGLLTCLTCGSDAERATLSFSKREDLRERLRRSRLCESSLLRIGLNDCCGQCFYLRLALLLGYCAW